MKREIKFRAWDEDRKNMLDWQLLKEKQSKFVAYKWLNVMQYTGLYDKNGKEIYEGDIAVVRHLHDGDECVWNNTKQEPIPFKVTWDSGKLGFHFDNSRMGYAPWDYEVIGNIYENPELIK